MMYFFARVLVGWYVVVLCTLIAAIVSTLLTGNARDRKFVWRRLRTAFLWPINMLTASGRADVSRTWKGVN